MKFPMMILASFALSACSNIPPEINSASQNAEILPAPTTLSAIRSEFSALPGNAGFVVEQLNNGKPNALIAAYNGQQQFAIASTFKLYILAELSDQIQAGKRNWGDVVPLSHRSFSSPATRNWPQNAPVSLATLALQMISVSDNSAADTLLHVLGRTQVERKLAQIGHSNPDKILPFLSTVEAFALKSPANAKLRERYLSASEAQQRHIIEREQAKLGFDQVDNKAFDNGPAFIGSLEWFASPYDMTHLMDHLRSSRNDQMMEIMAVNSGIPREATQKWDYIGYKGGDEPGVISMSFLLFSHKKGWYAVSGSWNNPAAEIDKDSFSKLMVRLIDTVEAS